MICLGRLARNDVHQFNVFFSFFFLSRFDYSVRSSRAERFYEEIRKYYPSLKDGSLQSGYAGIRPKLSGPRQTPADFVIQVISKLIILNYAYPKSLTCDWFRIDNK